MQRHKHKFVRRVDELNFKKTEGVDGGEAFLGQDFLTSSFDNNPLKRPASWVSIQG
jgi:hypothetical protein